MLDVKIILSDSNILVDSSGEYAVIENAKLYQKGKVDDEELVDEYTWDLPSFELAKKNGKWKFNEDNWVFAWAFGG